MRETKALKEQNDSLQRALERAMVQRDGAQAQVEEGRSALGAAQAEAEELRRGLEERSKQLVEVQRVAESAESARREGESRVEILNGQVVEKEKENARVREEMQRFKERFQSVRESVDKRWASFLELEERHQALLAEVAGLRSMAKDLSSTASEAMNTTKKVSEDGGWVSIMRESKGVIADLNRQLESSKEVTTILRDKLHHLASVVAESKARVEELEQEKRTSFAKLHQDYEELKTQYERSASLEQKVEQLTDRLVAREMESFDYLATAVGVEERLEAAKTEVERLNGLVSQLDGELVDLRKAKEEYLTKMLAAQEVTNAKDNEIIALRTQIKAANESKAEVRALWLEAKKTIGEKDEELLKRDVNPELEDRVKELTSQLETVQADLRSLEGKYARSLLDLNAAVNESEKMRARYEEVVAASTTQARLFEDQKEMQRAAFEKMAEEKAAYYKESSSTEISQLKKDAEAELKNQQGELKRVREALSEKVKTLEGTVSRITEANRALQEEKTRLQERSESETKLLVQSLNTEKAATAEWSAWSAKIDKMIEEKGFLQAALDDCRADLALARQEREQFRSAISEECSSALVERFASELKISRKESEAQELRAVAAERTITTLERELSSEKALVATLMAEHENTLAALALEEERRENLAPMDGLDDLRSQIETLSLENLQLRERALTILKRYHAGSLTDAEKELVRYVILTAESGNADVLVQKDQEIKSRDTKLAQLQQRVNDLEKKLAHELRKGAGGANTTTIVNLKSLMSSSPRDQVMGDLSVVRNTQNVPFKTPPNQRMLATSAVVPKPVENLAGPSTHISAKEPPQTKFARLAQMSEDDDDVPLSSLTSVSRRSEDKTESKPKRMRLMSSSPPARPVPAPAQTTKRRTKNGTSTKRGTRAGATVGADKKASQVEEVGKSRTLKRK
ncbi:hypothetical protein DFP72DRAFT_879785 [Ephemerocybe angulata]|uniref:Uncharacterized protein n=1 Tax=Ephemerocybe angulata TaxID=980116 RepID=A0A8H6MF86_9AGAR|nr:hypothetical protein DFP72DRAFT_879785 [Tulosesus angulatus]